MRLLSLFVISCLFIGCQSSDTTSTGTEQSSPAGPTMETEESTTEETTIVEDIEEPTEMVEPREIEISAYINDPDTENPTNVRSTPGGDVVLKLETGDYLLDLSIVENGWFKIDGNIDNVEGIIEIPGGEGWIHGSVLEVGSRNYGGQELLLYQSANEDSKVVYSFSNEEYFHLKDVDGDWALVSAEIDNEKIEGWIQLEWLCGNPLTNCS